MTKEEEELVNSFFIRGLRSISSIVDIGSNTQYRLLFVDRLHRQLNLHCIHVNINKNVPYFLLTFRNISYFKSVEIVVFNVLFNKNSNTLSKQYAFKKRHKDILWIQKDI